MPAMAFGPCHAMFVWPLLLLLLPLLLLLAPEDERERCCLRRGVARLKLPPNAAALAPRGEMLRRFGLLPLLPPFACHCIEGEPSRRGCATPGDALP